MKSPFCTEKGSWVCCSCSTVSQGKRPTPTPPSSCAASPRSSWATSSRQVGALHVGVYNALLPRHQSDCDRSSACAAREIAAEAGERGALRPAHIHKAFQRLDAEGKVPHRARKAPRLRL
jgi:hypothetical protein